jgi:branched-chain amino acid transport system permease protein
MKRNQSLVVLSVLGLVVLTLPLYVGAYPQAIGQMVFLYMSLAVSWDMLLRSGQISFGIAGFFGLGAYTSVLATLNLSLPPLLTILLGGVLAGVVAVIVGLVVLRLRGMYFAIVTLALAEIFRVVIRNWSSFTGGPEGEILPSVIFNGDSKMLYWLMLGVAVLTLVVSELFRRTRIHFALTSIRNNEMVASSSGVNIPAYLTIVFGVTSALQGIAGGAYAQVYGFVTPDGSFGTDFTLLPLAMALLGGIYGSVGPAIGAVILGVLAEYLKLYIPYGHQIAYGLIVVVVILFMPGGITGLVRRMKIAGGGK